MSLLNKSQVYSIVFYNISWGLAEKVLFYPECGPECGPNTKCDHVPALFLSHLHPHLGLRLDWLFFRWWICLKEITVFISANTRLLLTPRLFFSQVPSKKAKLKESRLQIMDGEGKDEDPVDKYLVRELLWTRVRSCRVRHSTLV